MSRIKQIESFGYDRFTLSPKAEMRTTLSAIISCSGSSLFMAPWYWVRERIFPLVRLSCLWTRTCKTGICDARCSSVSAFAFLLRRAYSSGIHGVILKLAMASWSALSRRGASYRGTDRPDSSASASCSCNAPGGLVEILQPYSECSLCRTSFRFPQATASRKDL